MTHDLDPEVINFTTFLLLKTEKHVLSKSCSELTLKPKYKKNSDMTLHHDPLDTIFNYFIILDKIVKN